MTAVPCEPCGSHWLSACQFPSTRGKRGRRSLLPKQGETSHREESATAKSCSREDSVVNTKRDACKAKACCARAPQHSPDVSNSPASTTTCMRAILPLWEHSSTVHVKTTCAVFTFKQLDGHCDVIYDCETTLFRAGENKILHYHTPCTDKLPGVPKLVLDHTVNTGA